MSIHDTEVQPNPDSPHKATPERKYATQQLKLQGARKKRDAFEMRTLSYLARFPVWVI